MRKSPCNAITRKLEGKTSREDTSQLDTIGRRNICIRNNELGHDFDDDLESTFLHSGQAHQLPVTPNRCQILQWYSEPIKILFQWNLRCQNAFIFYMVQPLWSLMSRRETYAHFLPCFYFLTTFLSAGSRTNTLGLNVSGSILVHQEKTALDSQSILAHRTDTTYLKLSSACAISDFPV